MRSRKFWVGLLVALVLATGVWQVQARAEDVFEVVGEVLQLVQEQYWRGVDANTLIKGAIKGILESLNDPYSVYLPPQNYDNFVQSATGSYAGVGTEIEVTPNGIRLARVFRNSPAAQSGLLKDDIILFIEGKDVRHMSLAEVAALMRGEVGTQVSLSYYRGTVDTLKTISITRAVVVQPSVDWEVLENDLGYMRVAMFGETMQADVAEAMADLANTRGIILDLRNCPGGLLDSLVKISPYFVKKAPLMVEISSGGEHKGIYSPGPGPDKPLVVLVNGSTASAAELLVGGIQDSKSGFVIGTKTYGKGVAQNVYDLGKDLGGFKVTSVGYFTPLGREITGVGLEPDLVVEVVSPEYLPPLAELISTESTLRAGMRGAEVKKLQLALKALGFFTETPYGFYGPVTQAAVKRFQQSMQMEVTGVATADVIESINVKLVRPPVIRDAQLDAGIEKVREMIGQ